MVMVVCRRCGMLGEGGGGNGVGVVRAGKGEQGEESKGELEK